MKWRVIWQKYHHHSERHFQDKQYVSGSLCLQTKHWQKSSRIPQNIILKIVYFQSYIQPQWVTVQSYKSKDDICSSLSKVFSDKTVFYIVIDSPSHLLNIIFSRPAVDWEPVRTILLLLSKSTQGESSEKEKDGSSSWRLWAPAQGDARETKENRDRGEECEEKKGKRKETENRNTSCKKQHFANRFVQILTFHITHIMDS